ncbi:MAG: hypothetical protein J7L39_02775 [Candidatus Aenigmarchaeota archaeon]|nr:hypothetical protein [Candidatus Aenigmarchaeota archaeon]
MSEIKFWRVTIEPEYAVWETCRDEGIIAIGYPESPDDFNVRRFKDEMKKGDKVVVYLKKKRIGALGTIVGDYSVDEVVLRGTTWLWRTRKVRWDHRSIYGWDPEDLYDHLSDDVKNALKGRDTVRELSRTQYEEIERLVLSW